MTERTPTLRALLLTAGWLAAVCAHCSGSTSPADVGPDVYDASSGDGGSDGSPNDAHADAAGRVPVNHRASDSQCTMAAPPGDCTIPSGPSDCMMDSDCSTGTNGRCIESTFGARLCHCTYDQCAHDTDCAAGQTCACHGSPETSGTGNTCIAGNCRTDSDCGATGYCSPTQSGSNCGGLAGYDCHTSGDLCIDDADCAGGMNGPRACMYSATNQRWECTALQLCP